MSDNDMTLDAHQGDYRFYKDLDNLVDDYQFGGKALGMLAGSVPGIALLAGGGFKSLLGLPTLAVGTALGHRFGGSAGDMLGRYMRRRKVKQRDRDEQEGKKEEEIKEARTNIELFTFAMKMAQHVKIVPAVVSNAGWKQDDDAWHQLKSPVGRQNFINALINPNSREEDEMSS